MTGSVGALLPPTPVTRTVAGVLLVGAAPFVLASGRRAPVVRWGVDESRLAWMLLAAPAALGVGAAGVLVTGRARWMLPAAGLATYLLSQVHHGLSG